MKVPHRFRWPVVLLLCLVVVGAFYIYVSSTPRHRILVVLSFSEMFPDYVEYRKCLAEQFRKAGVKVDVDYFYVDCNSLNSDNEVGVIRHYLDSLPADRHPHLIISDNDQATFSLLATQHPIVHHTPVVFGGVKYPNQALLSQYDNVTGVVDSIDVVETMRVARELTGWNNCFTMMDETFLDRKTRVECNRQLGQHPDMVNNLDWKLQLAQCYQIPADTLVLTSLAIRNLEKNTTPQTIWEEREQEGSSNFFRMLRLYARMNYIQLKHDAIAQLMLNFSSTPKFTATRAHFGASNGGLMAGYFASTATVVSDVVARAVRILQGEHPADIPIVSSAKAYYLDWNVYKQSVFTHGKVPAKYHIVNPSFMDFHPVLGWTLIVGGQLLVFIFIGWFAYSYATQRLQKTKAMKDLVEERNMLQLAIQNSHAFAWRRERDILTLEERFWSYLDEEPHTLPVDEFRQFIHPDSLPDYLSGLEQIHYDGDYTADVKCDFKGKGYYEWWQLRSHYHLDKEGQIHGMGLILNIDPMKRREKELIRMRKVAEEASLKESFLANMSHEIRTPLNAIVGFSNILATPGIELSDEEKSDFVMTINKNNDLLLKLVNDVLDISRIESGYMAFDFVSCPIGQLVDNVYQSYSTQAPHHLQFIYAKGRTDLALYIDEGRAQQVLNNFLTNAGKFTPKGSITLGWQYHAGTEEVEIYVADTGIGLSKEEQKMVFKRFYKSNQFKQGTGLGLSISQIIARRLNGRITVQSALGSGSRFSLWLPATVLEYAAEHPHSTPS